MASFVTNLFPGGKQEKADGTPRPSTPSKNSFTTPVSTPQGSPSKKTNPPGANELPVAFENLKLNSTANALESPVKLGRPQSSGGPLSPGKSNIQHFDESSVGIDESIIHKGVAGSPLRKQGQENTPPAPARNTLEPSHPPSHAASSRQELYAPKDRPLTPAKKFNTSRGLTPEELEILKKPNVKRLVNVTQLCESILYPAMSHISSLT
jgi:hypothetical protein